MAVLDLGRVVVKTTGRECTKKAVIVGFVDENFVLITGAGVNKVKRRRCNIKHLLPTPHKIDIESNASDSDIKTKLETSNMLEDFTEDLE